MRELLRRPYLRATGKAGAGSKERQWQRVPRIDVLPRAGTATNYTFVIRGVLAVALLVELLLLPGLYTGRTDNTQAVVRATAQLKAVQQSIGAENQTTSNLQAQLAQLQEQRNAADEAYRRFTAGHLKWSPALASLLGPPVDGVRLDSLTSGPDGQISVAGVATNLEAMARLQAQLLGASKTLAFQGMVWEIKDSSITFTADIKVNR